VCILLGALDLRQRLIAAIVPQEVGACAITADLTGKLSAAARTPH
jgi:hypothetical protein